MPSLISSAQLDKFTKGGKNIAIFDVTQYGVGEGDKNAHQAFLDGHIFSAKFLDLSLFCDSSSVLPNTVLLDQSKLQDTISQLGITNDHKIIFYDHSSHHTSFRAIWLFKLFGHAPDQLYLYDGGLEEWRKFGGKIESGESANVKPKPYDVRLNLQYLRTLDQIKKNLRAPTEQVVDMRHPTRFSGGKEPRPHLRQGHIPGSFSFPSMTMFDKAGRLKSFDKIKSQLTGMGVQLEYPIVSMCGSGMTACVLDVVLDLLGHQKHSVYDGSWTEWASEQLYSGEINLSERPVKTSLE